MRATELRVAAIYARILELLRVEVDDDLYDLGGDSIQAVQIALEIERTFRIGLPIETMERSTRVRDLAAEIDRQVAAKSGTRG